MTRAMDDRTSTCESCVYWSRDKGAPGAPGPKSGYCNWHTLPAWAHKPHRPYDNGIPRFAQSMNAEEGVDCWLHTKRDDGRLALINEALRVASEDRVSYPSLVSARHIRGLIKRLADELRGLPVQQNEHLDTPPKGAQP